jgi:dTDP-4-amino-4,6-dideoxygalactose transaminase
MPYQKYYQEKYNLSCSKLFPNALRAYKKGLVLPLYCKLDENDILRVSDILINLTK